MDLIGHSEAQRFDDYLARAKKQHERYRRTLDVRQPPMPPWFHKPAKGGQCRWCGTRDLPGRRKSWCSDDCLNWYWCATGKRTQWMEEFLLRKHRHKCGACFRPLACMRVSQPHYIDPAAKPRSAWSNPYGEYMPDGHRRRGGSHWPYRQRRPGIASSPDGPFSVLYREYWNVKPALVGGYFCPVEPGYIPYQIDHIVPLWSVDRQLPWDSLIQYWLPGNLWPLCELCHKAKTRREAKERAGLRAQDADQLDLVT